MLMIIVTDFATGTVTNVQPLDTYTAILDEFDAWCTDVARNSAKHVRVTLWDTGTNMTHGSREVNKPPMVVPTTEEIRTWIKKNCRVELDSEKKIPAIKKAREAFWTEGGFKLGLKDAKDHVEAVIAEEKKEKLMSVPAKRTPTCGYIECDNESCQPW